MDYWQQVEWHRWANWTAFAGQLPAGARLRDIESEGRAPIRRRGSRRRITSCSVAKIGGFAPATAGAEPGMVVADSDVQSGVAVAESRQLRGGGVVRGFAAAGVSRGVCRLNSLPPLWLKMRWWKS